MLFLTSILSILTYFFLHYLWKYFENEYGIFTSLFSISIIILTLYGVYIYFKKSLHSEIYFELNINKSTKVSKSNNNSMLNILERYNKEKENYLSDGLIAKQGEGDSNENNIKKITSQNAGQNEAEDLDKPAHNFKQSFFGLIMNSPKISGGLSQKNNFTLSNEICSPSILADTFIQAASIARNSQCEYLREATQNIQPIVSDNPTENAVNAEIKAIEANSFNSRLLNSVGHSFHTNLKSAKNRFEDYLSSLQFKNRGNKPRNSLPGRFPSKASSESFIKTDARTNGYNSIPNILIESFDDTSTKVKTISSTPTRKIYNSFLSPLPTSKPSQILLLTGKNE